MANMSDANWKEMIEHAKLSGVSDPSPWRICFMGELDKTIPTMCLRPLIKINLVKEKKDEEKMWLYWNYALFLISETTEKCVY